MISSLLFLIDIFGKPVTINFFGQAKYKSQLGGICTILFLGFLGWALYTASGDFFSRKNPTVITSEIYIDDPKRNSLTVAGFDIAVQVITPVRKDSLPFINESIYTVQFQYGTVTRTKDEDGNIQEDLSYITLPHEICTPGHFGAMGESFAKLDLSTMHCIAKERTEVNDIAIQGLYISSVYHFLAISVTRCFNDTSCASEDEIKDYLNGAWAYVYYPDTGIDPSNFTHPNKQSVIGYSTMVSLTTFKEAYLDVAPIYVTTDSGWIIPEQETKNYSRVNKLYEYLQLDSSPEGVLLNVYLECDSREIYYTRTYKKIQNVLAEVGGLANIAFVILIILTAPYLNLKFRESLINELFDIHPITPPKEKKNSKKKKKNNDIRDAASTTVEDKRQKTDKDRLTSLEMNQATTEVIKTEKIITTNPNQPSLANREPRLSPKLRIERSRTKQDANSESLQTEKDPLCLAPSSPLLQVNSFLSNPDEKDFLSFRTAQAENKQKTPNENSPKSPNIETEDHVMIRIKESKDLEGSNVKHKTVMTKLRDKHDISDNVSDIFEHDNFSDTPSENNKQQELDFPFSSEQKEEPEKERIEKEIDLISEDEQPETNKNRPNDRASTQARKSLKKEPYRISVTLGEFFLSPFYQSEALKHKMQIIAEGTRKLDTRLDVVAILKKMREIDKLKAMLFDLDQAMLFNNLPKPELRPKSLNNNEENVSSSAYGLLRKFTLREHDQAGSSIRDMQIKLESKPKRSKIEERFIAVFKEKEG